MQSLLNRKYRNYIFLVPLVVLALVYQIAYMATSIWVNLHETEIPKLSIERDAGGRVRVRSAAATKAGVQPGDTLLTIDGKQDRSQLVLIDDLRTKHVGDLMNLVVRHTNGQTQRISLPVERDAAGSPTTGDWIITILVNVMLLVSVSLGSYVVLRLPNDPSAVFLFGMLIGLGHYIRMVSLNFWPHWALIIGTGYSVLLLGTFPLCMMLFGIYFPQRSRFELRRPWIKWLFIVPIVAFWVAQAGMIVLSFFDLHTAAAGQAQIDPLGKPIGLVSFFAQGIFFLAIGNKMSAATSRDAKRRLRILHVGATVSLTPLLLLVIYVFGFKHGEFSAVPQQAAVPIVLFFLLLPITLSYAVLVERATDLRVAIRQGLQYASAKAGLRIVSYVAIGACIWLTISAISTARFPVPIQIGCDIGASFLIVLVLRRASIRLAGWIDRRFFREAYQSEQILNDLNESLQTLTDETTLLQTVGTRISESLHVPCVAILLNRDGRLTPAYAVGVDHPSSVAIDERSYLLNKLKSTKDIGQVYWDTPQNWVFTAPPSEVDAIRALQSQLLLPICVRDRTLGILSLGPKRSEEPYSKTDLHLLKSIAFQMGLALENSRLANTVALEVAGREKLNREIEIAREVQQRLFPHEMPLIPGIDYFGACRPALGVGGDYYDFLQLGDGKVGIAVGDVSGKGIAAALLMASLQASLRGQALQGSNDLTATMGAVNRLVYDASSSNRYATFFYAQYESANHRLTYVNAGHNPPFILRPRDGIIHVIRLETGGPVIGLFPRCAIPAGHSDDQTRRHFGRLHRWHQRSHEHCRRRVGRGKIASSPRGLCFSICRRDDSPDHGSCRPIYRRRSPT